MKRGIRLLSVVATLAVVAVLGAPTADAACGALVQFASGLFPNYNYMVPPGPGFSTSTGSGLSGSLAIGRFWEVGNRALENGDGFPAVAPAATQCFLGQSWWCSYNPAAYGWYLRANFTNPGVNGCPGVPGGQDPNASGTTDEIIVVLLDKNSADTQAAYYVARPSFNAAAADQFDMGPPAGWTPGQMQLIPRPNVTGSSRVNDTTVSLNVSLADVAPAFQGRNLMGMPKSPHASITGYRLCSFEGAADPGRNASLWNCGGPISTVVPTAPGGSSASRSAVCSGGGPGNPNNLFVATQLVFDGGAYASEYVSSSVMVECDPTIAQPEELEPRRPADRPDLQRRGTKGR